MCAFKGFNSFSRPSPLFLKIKKFKAEKNPPIMFEQLSFLNFIHTACYNTTLHFYDILTEVYGHTITYIKWKTL